MSHRFRFIGEMAADGTWRLTGDEAHHLVKVVRLDMGAEIEVTDGRGSWAIGTVGTANTREVVVAPTQSHKEEAAPAPFVFAIGALKPGGVDEILPALAELGADEIWVFQQAESDKSRMADRVVERWKRIIIQSVKQCKRAWVPGLRTFVSMQAMVAAVKTRGDTLRVMLAPDADISLKGRLEAAGMKPLIVVAGGEKGLAPIEERALREAGFIPASLGPHVLRAVTAAVAAAAVVSAVRANGGT